MISMSVQGDVSQLVAKLKSITEQKQLRYAVAVALTKTAQEVQAEVRRNMSQRFTLRRQWIVNGIRYTPADKRAPVLETVIYSKDEAFMGRQEIGGDKRPMRDTHIAVPLKDVRRTVTQMIRSADLPAALGKASFDITRTNTRTGASKTRTVKGDGGEVVKIKSKRGIILLCRRRKGRPLEVLYALMPKTHVKERLGLRSDGMRIAKERFLPILNETFEKAVSTAR